MRRAWIVSVMVGVLAPVFGGPLAAPDPGLEDALACAQFRLPDTPRVWSVSFVSTTRDGAERRVRANLFSRSDDGSPVMVTRLTAPDDLAGSRLFMFQSGGATQIYLQTSDMERPKRVQGERTSVKVFGTDFSYEDFEHIYGLNRPGATTHLADTEFDGRPVRVLKIKPAGGDASAYTNIHAFVDTATCVPLRMEFYSPADRMRKLLTVDPQDLEQGDATYRLHSMRMRDLVDETETRLIVLGQRPTTSFPEVPSAPPDPSAASD